MNEMAKTRVKCKKNSSKFKKIETYGDQMTTSDRVTSIKPTHTLFYVGETTVIDRNTQLTAKNG